MPDALGLCHHRISITATSAAAAAVENSARHHTHSSLSLDVVRPPTNYLMLQGTQLLLYHSLKTILLFLISIRLISFVILCI